MDTVQTSRWLPHTPQTIYEFLTTPDALAAVVKRIEQARVVERQGEQGKVAVTLDLPARKTVDTIGEVDGLPYEQLSFKTQDPFPLHFQWQLAPHTENGQHGTQVTASLGVDLSAFGIPIAGLLVRSIIASELKEDLGRLANGLAG